MRTNRLLSLGMALLISTYWLYGDAFDIQLYDTYFVVGWSFLIRTVGIFCLLIGVVRVLINRTKTG